MNATSDPLLGPVPDEIPLPRSPLVRVLVQVKFPLIASIEKPEFIGAFQEALRAAYPVLRQEQTQSVLLGSNSLVSKPQTTWRFSAVDSRWRVSLSPEFFAIETVAYSGGKEFLTRLVDVTSAVKKHIEPKLVDRIGVRFINRLVGDALPSIPNFVRPEVAGILGTPVARHSQHLLTEALFASEEGQILSKWGLLPAGTSIDTSVLEPIDEPCWILDLDMFTLAAREFDVESVHDRTKAFVGRLYAFFRWAVTDEFLRHYGGTT